MADVDSKAAEKAKKVAAAKKKLAAYRKSKKPKASSPLVEGDEISDTTSEASYSVSSDVASIISVDDRSTPDNEKLDETIVRPEESSALQKQLQVCYNRMAELEEMVDGKSAALVSLSEENARLSTELSSYKQNGSVNGDTTPNKPHENGDGIDVQQLTAHLQQYRAAVAQRDQALQQLLEQNRLLQEQNRQLQTPSRSASEDGLDYAAETESLKMRVSLLSEQLEQANATLARQSAPSPQPILDAKEEIISLQQTLAAQEQALLHLKSVVSERDRELDLLKSDITEKDCQYRHLV
ncbi:hypothetical protein EB796_021522 [Bugula neritina]|uniref:Uncharacterized protein n=1 Tax=Bugula neritina TaxID=10212 RepID=A0A7J7J1Y1_BUGNE|nr:hypothetical protein EB796_021522 [Bugula neritina]